MSIKQGEYLKKLRSDNKLSQEQLAEKIGISRQSVSKWEQGISTPDTENLSKLAHLYSVSVDSLLNGEPDIENTAVPIAAEESDNKTDKPKKKKRGWLFASYPVLMVILYAVIGVIFSSKGWALGWIVFLTIPLFYTGIIAAEKKKPVIFCYPVLVLIIFLLCGFFLKLWHPVWILFLTIPLYYIISVKSKK